MADQNDFLADMQSSFLEEAQKALSKMRVSLERTKQDAPAGLKEIHESVCALREGLNSLSYPHLNEYMGKFAAQLERLIAAWQGRKAEESDIVVLEFFMMAVFNALRLYLDDLKSVGVDSEVLRSRRDTPMEVLSGWAPAEAGAGNEVAPSTSEPPVSVEMEEHSVSTPTHDAPSFGTYFLFENCGQQFAIAVANVVEIVKSQEIYPSPVRKPHVLGLVNLRGDVLPVLALKAMRTAEIKNPRYVVVSQINGQRFCFQAEAVHRIVTIDHHKIQKMEAFESGSDKHRPTEFYENENTIVSILKIENLVAA